MVNANGFCDGALTAYPIDSFVPGLPPNEIGIIMAISGLLNILMSLGTIYWIKRKEWEAQQEGGGEDAAKSVIFPVFVVVVWGNVLANIYAGVVVALVPLNPAGANQVTFALLYASQTAFHHVVTEGIAFLLLQKGCGYNAGREAGKLAFFWGLITFGIMFFIYHEVSKTEEAVNLVWDFVLAIFYGALWLAPQQRLYRRPALISYSKFWFLYRVCAMLINLLLFSPPTTGAGNCSYIVVQIVFYSVYQPLVCYWTLLQDSRWWQGLDIGDQNGARTPSYENIRSPLLGSDFSLTTAQSLAATMDQIRVHGHVKMLNFACIKIDFNKPLGSGSFSKVCRGSYRGKECAIKLIYTVDLTTDVIRRVAAEASILSSIRHPNIVHIYGVSVLPPSVCLILEICSFGSLSDIIRGYGFDWSSSSRAPLSLAYADVLHLALGCARGLAAVHAYDRYLCHRDVKSFNFLVDHQFNVKIADLELGVRDKEDVARRRAGKKDSKSRKPRAQGRDKSVSLWKSWTSSVSNSFFSANNTDKGARDEHGLLSDNSRHRPQDYDGDDDDISVGTGRSGYSTGSYNSHTSRQHLDNGNDNLVDELLANWMAPEVITQRKFQQASDVYALGTVMWEILAKKLPFEQCETQREIRQLIIGGYQHPIPEEAQESPLAYIIQECWQMDPSRRPKAQEVVRFIEKILHEDVFRSRIPEGFIAHCPDFTTMMHYYEACYRKSTVSDVQSHLRLHIPQNNADDGFFSRIWGIFTWPLSSKRNGRRRRRPQSSTSYSASRASSSRATSSNTGYAANNAANNNNGNSNVLSMLNPKANHYEEEDDAEFAFTLPSYSVRGSELNATATALSVAADLRHSMKDRHQSQKKTSKNSNGGSTHKTSTNKGNKSEAGQSSGRATSTDAVAADKLETDDSKGSIGVPTKHTKPNNRDVSEEYDEEDDIESYGANSNANTSNKRGNDDDDDDEDDDHQKSNDGYMSSLARMAMPMPPAAMEAVTMVKNESFWYELEASKEAWAIVTPKAPYIIVHGTKTWFQRFSTVTSTPASGFAGPDAPMLSLLALLAPEIEAMPQQTHATNTYVQLASQQHSSSATPHPTAADGSTLSPGDGNGFRKMRSASAKEILKAMQREEEYHGVLSLHMPNIQATANRPFHHSSGSTSLPSHHKSSGESGLLSFSRNYSSPLGNAMVSVDATGRLTGSNTMFSVHIYPVHYNRAIAMANPDSIDSNAGYNVAASQSLSMHERPSLSAELNGRASAASAAMPPVTAAFMPRDSSASFYEEPLILPPLHQTTQPDAAHMYTPPSITAPIPIPAPQSLGAVSSPQPSTPTTSAIAVTPSTPNRNSGRITSYIDDYRTRRSSAGNNAMLSAGVDISSVPVPLSTTPSQSLPRPGILSANASSTGDNQSQAAASNTNNTNRSSFFTSRMSHSQAPKVVTTNTNRDRPLIYYAILFHELREQSEQFLHPQVHQHHAASATSTVGRFFSRSNPVLSTHHERDDRYRDDSYDEADAARTMSRTYSKNARTAGQQPHELQVVDDDGSEEHSMSLAEEEEEYVRRYRESSSGSSHAPAHSISPARLSSAANPLVQSLKNDAMHSRYEDNNML